MNEMQQIQIESAAELRAWLEANYASQESVWVVTWKKGSGKGYVSYDEIVDQCICFGWVDSLPRKLDENRSVPPILKTQHSGMDQDGQNRDHKSQTGCAHRQ